MISPALSPAPPPWTGLQLTGSPASPEAPPWPTARWYPPGVGEHPPPDQHVHTHRRQLLIRAWEEAVEGTLEDGLVSLDEENALAQYADHFDLTQEELNRNGAQTTMVQAAVIRDVTQGIVPQRQTLSGAIPFNLMKSETLVWVIDGVDYLETVTRRERQRHLPRSLDPGGERTLLQPAPVPESPHRMGGDSPRRYRSPGA